MKYIIASDIHGSSYYTKKMQEIILKENPDKIILLGDIYYHGPRNDLPKKYNPKLVCEILNGFADKVICVKGNCDAEVDQMISKFKFEDSFELDLTNKKALFVHGHKLDKQTPPAGFNIIFSGHTHIAGIESKNDIIFINPGSLSIPKGKEKNSYALLTDTQIIINELSGKTIYSQNI